MTRKTLILTLPLFAIFLSGCTQKQNVSLPTPTPPPRSWQLTPEEKPYLNLIPRNDGHEIKLSLKDWSTSVTKIEYEFIYIAQDNDLEIEKGASGDLSSDKMEEKILLGTSSCTNGCKYKYDYGITGGKVILNLINKSSQVLSLEYPWSLQSQSEINKKGKIELKSESFSQNFTQRGGDFYTIVKNPQNYSIFSSSRLIKDVPLTGSSTSSP